MGNNSAAHEHHGHHIVPAALLTKVLVILVVLTILTVVTARLNAGPLVAFGIAGYKAYLVMAHFMGLKYEDPLNRWIFGSGFFFLALLFVFCILDILTRAVEFSTL